MRSRILRMLILSAAVLSIGTTANAACLAENEPCDDGDACTLTDVCDASLVCVGIGAVACDDNNPCTQNLCVAETGCSYPPGVVSGCNATAGKAKLSMRWGNDPSEDGVQFQWQKGTTSVASFGTPAVSTTYTLCVTTPDRVVIAAFAQSGSTCGDEPCWASSTKGVKYVDKSKPPVHDGYKQISGKGSDTAGKSSINLKLSGENIASGFQIFGSYPVTVQLLTDDAGCWEQQFSQADEKVDNGTSPRRFVHVVP